MVIDANKDGQRNDKEVGSNDINNVVENCHKDDMNTILRPIFCRNFDIF